VARKGSPEGMRPTPKHRGAVSTWATHIRSLPQHFFAASHRRDYTALLSTLFQYFTFKAFRKFFPAPGVLVAACILAQERFG